MLRVLWIYFLLFDFGFQFSKTDMSINEAPAKVTLKLQMSKLNQGNPDQLPRLKLCVDKLKERCYWKLQEEVQWDGDQFKDKEFQFFTDNMGTNITLDITIESGVKKVTFPRKLINLANFNSKSSFSIYSLNLESLITVTIEHECEDGYYPPRQCTKVCFPTAGESECDGFGNKICKDGLLYNAEMDRCISNNCMKSSSPCRNGRCVSNALTIKCICLESYIGEYCQYKNPCFPNPCFNGGRCIPNGMNKSYRCSCPTDYSSSRCETKIAKNCPCPENMKCNYSDNGTLESCTPNSSFDMKDGSYISKTDADNNGKMKIGGLGSKKEHEWYQLNFISILVAGVGFLIILLCIIVSIFLYCRTRDNRNHKDDGRTNHYPSTLYTEFTPKLNETSFERSFSLDDNFVYLPTNSEMLHIIPNNFTMGSSTAYSLNSNSYQDNGNSSFRNMPLHGSFLCQQQCPVTPLLLQHSYTKNTNSSVSTISSTPAPPVLPPRQPNIEQASFDTSSKLE